MNNFAAQDLKIENVDSPFTEIFALLTKYEITHDQSLRLAYSSDELRIIRHHVANVVDVLLQGLQYIGAQMENYDRSKIPLERIGPFISLLSNLIEALNWVTRCA